MNTPKLIAFYLPQFHPIPENDQWWGRGFTEWTNVTQARPLHRGHYQPHLPADLGFYDLRLPETRAAQADLAREYGIYGFCYYHYWFQGRRLLSRPFDDVLSSGEPDYPFCLCWANANWTKKWYGKDDDILVRQQYSHDDDVNHIRWMCTAFRDDRYIRVEGKPLLLVFRVIDMPAASKTAALWRDEARKAGIGDIFLCTVDGNFARVDPRSIGFDAAVEFQPDLLFYQDLKTRIWLRFLRKLFGRPLLRYSELVRRALEEPPPGYRRFRGVTPGWDNTPRRGRGAFVLEGSTPDTYATWLSAVIENSSTTADGDKLIFVNAWNEWAEGNHLEPCQKWGRSYLEATRRALETARLQKTEHIDRTSVTPVRSSIGAQSR